MEFYKKSKKAVLDTLNTSESGLTQAEAKKRLLANGPNQLAQQTPKGIGKRFLEQVANPMVLVLLAAASVSLVIAILTGGSAHEYAEAGIIFAVVVLNSVLGVLQESKAEKAIDALRRMSAATAKVRRDGIVSVIPSEELVLGDVVLLEAGDSVPADLRLLLSASLQIEEAALTGESVPSEKNADFIKESQKGDVPLGDRKNMAYMSSGVTYGRGEGVVTSVGMDTQMGKIAGIIQNTQDGETPLQRKLSHLSKVLSVIVLGICAIIFAVRFLSAGEFSAEAILESFMLAVALAVAAIPEGLAAVVTIVLSIGVTNMAKRSAIIRRLPAVETLGCAQIICSDKTGTLTQNKMTVVESYGDTHLLAKAMALCSDSQLAPDGNIVGDPTENALVAFALQHGLDKNKLSMEMPRMAEAPFDSVRKMMTTIHRLNDGYIQFTKGAPDEILRVCTHALTEGKIVPLNADVISLITERNKAYADKALRVLACAYKELRELPADCHHDKLERELIFIGLEAMIDPVRPEVKAAIEECGTAGIKAVMITGDHKETAAAIAMELGIIKSPDQAMTGRELSELPDCEFEKRIENTFVYARVQPEHKVRIVNMWKSKGYVTAMTGDGVNDAPAIKSGDIGIGMGITGTDVTKNVADMVLADDNFATIVSAVAEGRRIYDNIRKTLQFLLSTNLSEIIAILASTLMGFTLFKPVHLLFINLITDTVPAVALGMEEAQEGIMKRPPRGVKESVFSGGVGAGIVYQGFLIALITLSSYFLINHVSGTEYAMTAAFFTLSMCEIFQAFTLRSLNLSVFRLKRQNKVLWGAAAISLAATLLVIYVPFLSSIFSLKPLTLTELAISAGLSVLVLPMVEMVKAFTNHRIN